MKMIKIVAAMLMGLAVSACASSEPEFASRNAPLETPEQIAPVAVSVQTVTVSVPRALKVSEANRFYPGGDIVWREDPRGDRHVQVQRIVQDAMVKGVTGLNNGVPVELYVEVTRFHALTQKARYTTGGVHDLEFTVTLRDPATGNPLTEPRLIRADLKAYGGKQAIAAEGRGETQKVRITNHLAEVIRAEITQPGSYKSADLGMMRLFNKSGS
ncbi:hypothetical protein G5B38_03915 [Pseudohalocynthiibacter aestuariivivens]|uniref:Lipoprotein n=1 Tax=Roseovarius pelagicus TaxID=2980108 RepID=A0ABY6DB72_9RHOB|nr:MULTISPECIES: DUF6778 family protein [Rhodobacterales]QIE44740.1 hypothetical protein G5B38_03915 [Pseudohalocynthiibacter aestuariivivens]UXX83348.1 hypothetical protein N7U68_01285 [Roseovarius pelagicus]